MKLNILNYLIIVLFGITAFSCSNKELESRIAKLEGKVAELEAKNGPTINAPASTTANQPEVKPDGPLPAFKFSEDLHDFGTVNEPERVSHVFTFENVGEAPLIISSATATCGCTVPEWPKEPIPVGGTGEIKVEYNSANKSGIQNKTVTITANTYPKKTQLRIRANVVKTGNPS